jgi:hypothetical protein
VVLALHGEAVAAYYRRAFEADWRGGGFEVPAVLVVAALLAAGLTLVVLRRRVSWGTRDRSSDERWALAEERERGEWRRD